MEKYKEKELKLRTIFIFTFVVKKSVTFVVTFFYICSSCFLHLSLIFTYVTNVFQICGRFYICGNVYICWCSNRPVEVVIIGADIF